MSTLIKRTLLLLLIAGGSTQTLNGQYSASERYRDFPLVITLQFHALSMPFKDLKANFSNIGIGIGTEVSYGSDHKWVQQLNLMWYRNKNVGNGLFLYSQAAWRPTIVNHFYGELKMGAGYMLTSRPTASFRQENGHWISAGKKGKGVFVVPIGTSMGHHAYSERTYVSPFASYQLLLLKGYSKSMPLVPETLIQLGSRIHFKN